MSTECLLPATLAECRGVLIQLPDLTAPGFDNYYADRHKRKIVRRANGGLSPTIRCQPTPITNLDVRTQISRARLFLTENCFRIKTIRREINSYEAKHEAEQWIGNTYSHEVEIPYISNGAFIAAAWLEGYAIERAGPNAVFSLSFTLEYRRLRRQRPHAEISWAHR